MLLIFVISVLSCYPRASESHPLPPGGPAWRQSRYIIDNRKNFLFSGKPLQKQTTFSYQKDLTAEASIAEPKYNPEYNDNSLPRKILKPYKVPIEFNYKFFGNPKNSSGVDYYPQNWIQNDEDLKYGEEDSGTTTQKVWMTELEENVPPSPSPSSSSKPPGWAEESGETTSFPWEYNRKTEEGNQIDANEKHVYETRIETVSYHQEVIFNPPKKKDWYRKEKEQEETYEEHEKNYEEQEKNYEEQEKNYEEQEKNYEEQEKNYEEPEKTYEGPNRNYEVDESANVMPNGREEEENQNKFGYVVEGQNFRKYRVEERTVDGFIVGEYGVVSHDDGSLRGVRYTADGAINPKLIYETLIKFLSL